MEAEDDYVETPILLHEIAFYIISVYEEYFC